MMQPTADPAGHHCVNEKTWTVLVNIGGDHRVKRKSKECGVNAGYSKNCPRAKRLQHGPDKPGVTGDNIPEDFQDKNSTAKEGAGESGQLDREKSNGGGIPGYTTITSERPMIA